MFRLTHFLRELVNPTPPAHKRPTGPVVIWNVVRRCNLRCRHCYSFSADTDYAGELTTQQMFDVMDDLRAFGVPVLILSGGEPLLRPDLFDIAARAKSLGFYVGLSTNGTLIDDRNVDRIAAAGFDYIGISLDGRHDTHDAFRRQKGAFDAALAAVCHCRDAGAKVGIRFTLTQDNAQDLPWLLDLLARERIDKFYLSHLNYAGRGNIHRGRDAFLATTRAAMNLLIERAWESIRRRETSEIVTGNNDADGPYLLFWARRYFPQHEAHLRRKLEQWGGNASGVNVANIDNLGEVHPDTFWWDYSLGNVKQRPFSRIWTDLSDPILAGLKQSPRPVKGRCAACAHFGICGGNTRVRARALTGDPWEEDPACYLTDEEIGMSTPRERLAVRPFHAGAGRSKALP